MTSCFAPVPRSTLAGPCARWSPLTRSSLILRQSISGKTAAVGQSDESSQTLSSDLLAPRSKAPGIIQGTFHLFLPFLGQILRAVIH